MFKEQRKIKNWKILLSGLAIVIPFLPLTAFAIPGRPNPKRNPCPKIYYEEPYNSKLIVPAECTPNAATMRWKQTGQAVDQSNNIVPRTTNVRPIQPPAPEALQSPIATVKPMMDGKVSVTLKNDINARISYQAITHTEVRYLEGGEEVILRDIPTPVTITMVREDRGLLRVMPMIAKDGMLSVNLGEETRFDNNQGVLRIQKNGDVFLN